MAKQQGPVSPGGSVLGKVAKQMRAAHEAHKNDETEYSKFGELPAGIEGGIARLVEAKFDVYKEGANKGEPYFYAAGVVVSPAEFTTRDGATFTIEGLRTQLNTIPLCDTKNGKGEVTTLEEHVKRLYNELRKLGLDTANLAFDDLEPAVAQLKALGPFFKFRTWQGRPTDQYPDPKTNHDWQGYVKYAPQGNGQAVQDNTPKAGNTQKAAPPAPPKAPPTQPKGAPPKPPSKGPAAKAPPAPEPEPDVPVDFGDLASLVEAAQNDDEAAQQELTRLAEAAGKADEAAQATTWQQVADLIEEGQGGGGEEGDEEWAPQVGQMYGYRPIGKDRKPAANQILAEVMEVDTDAQTVKLRNSRNLKQTYSAVPWTDLETAD